MKTFTSQKKKLMARRLHQYWQFRDKNSRNILRDIWDFFGILIYVYIYIYIRLFIYLYVYYTISSRTLVGKHCSNGGLRRHGRRSIESDKSVKVLRAADYKLSRME